ncbi:MAG: saccharopine dehydrogenase NADP-binding domain-containing protein [Desulfovibrio sp.]|nr:saccharopine dehydrogenase NADP-binding domain-containing protein [Desulfovibrio sp.]
MQKTVGVLGGYGRVGSETARWCAKLTDARILIGGRSLEKALQVARQAGPNAEALSVDIGDQTSLGAFASQCDLLLNTAGPAAKIGMRPALAALDRGISYLDVSGTEALYRDLSAYLGQIRAKGLSFVIAAGIFPGLSGVFPAAMAKRYFTAVDTLEISFVSEGDTLSFNAAYDVVASLADGFAQGMRQYVDGSLTSSGVTPREIVLPDPIGAVQGYPSLSQELILLARKEGFHTVRGYLAILDSSLKAMFKIRSEKLFQTEEQRIEAANLMVEATKKDLANRRRCTMYHLAVKGTRTGGEQGEVVSIMEFRSNDAELTGIVAACSAQMMLEGRTQEPGCSFLCNGVDPDELMTRLEGCGIRPVVLSGVEEERESGDI